MATDDQIPNLDGLVDALVEGVFDPRKLTRLQNAIRNAVAEGHTIANATVWRVVDTLIEGLAEVFEFIEENTEIIAGPVLARIVAHLLNTEVTVHELREKTDPRGDTRIGKAAADLALQALGSDAGELTPGHAGAEKFLAL